MKTYLALITIDLKLAVRDKMVVFFNYLFPLIFFFVFAEMMDGAGGSGTANIVTMVITMGILGNGLFGAGMRLVQEREQNILRRFKVTPISPAPILVASMVTGWLIYIPAVVLTCGLAHFLYHMPIPDQWPSFLVLVSAGVFAFRALGLIIASVVNSTQESTIAIQLFYMPMLFLSGATIPVTLLPDWAQIASQFLPASYLITGFQGVFLKGETLARNWPALAALSVTILLGMFISMQIFRWEKGEKMRPRTRLWVLAVLSPFVALGSYQAYTKEHIQRADILWRELQRSEPVLIRDARIFTGNGKVVESGSVLIEHGKIEGVFEGRGPSDPRAEIVEASGKTLLPGLIDVHVHLGAPGGFLSDWKDYDAKASSARALAAYLYSGVTAVKSAGDWQDLSFALRDRVAAGRYLGAELFACGPMFTAQDGHGTEYIESMPESMREMARRQLVRTPKSAAEARQQVQDLAKSRADGIKAIVESGRAGQLFERIDLGILRAVADEARARNLPLVVHTGNARDIADTIDLGIAGFEHGSFADPVPDEVFARMAKLGIAYDPTLSVVDVLSRGAPRRLELLSRSLVEQVGPAKLIEETRKKIQTGRQGGSGKFLDQARDNLRRAHRAGVTLVTGSDAGNPLVIHGPTVQRELALWVEAGIPPAVALQAATLNAARLLRAEHRIGLIEKGHEATLLLVDGNPLVDIAATERISLVIFKGERIRRSKLFDQK